MKYPLFEGLLGTLLMVGTLPSQEAHLKPFRTPPVPLTAEQLAYLQQLQQFIACVLIFCGQGGSELPDWSKVEILGDVNGMGGLITYPDEVLDPLMPTTGGGVYNPEPGNVIAIDPGCFSSPANGVAVYWRGTGPNINGLNGAPGPAPGLAGDPEQEAGIGAAQLYGELAHQTMKANYQVGGQPATPEDDAGRRASEARVYSRASLFLLWAIDCQDPCWTNWGKTLSPEDKINLQEKAAQYAHTAKEFEQQ